MEKKGEHDNNLAECECEESSGFKGRKNRGMEQKGRKKLEDCKTREKWFGERQCPRSHIISNTRPGLPDGLFSNQKSQFG
jgi:hypothetical protein